MTTNSGFPTASLHAERGYGGALGARPAAAVKPAMAFAAKSDAAAWLASDRSAVTLM